jgi:histidyl-tRNA synthetase
MGQKEAMEDSMVVRDILSRKQETVSLKDLPKYLKSLKGSK